MDDEQVQRRLAAILAADVVGYTKLMEAAEEQTIAALRQLRREFFDPTVAKHGGRIFKVMGDGLLVEFGSVLNATRCAVEIQRGMVERNAGVPEDRRILFRIGVNLGDLVVDGDDFYGDGVNLASRLEGLAVPGSIACSAAVREQIGNRLDLTFVDHGEKSVKNISHPVRVYSISVGAPSAQTPAPNSGIQDLAPPSAQRADLKEFTSLAVLPFTNMSGGPEHDYLADGISEDIITEISRFKNLAVVARNTTFTYKGRSVDVVELGRQLGADYVVEGSIRVAGTRIRATVQLIDAESGAHVLAEKFDREMADIFAVQDEIVQAILGRLSFNLRDAAATRRTRNPTTNLSAYTCWLRSEAAFRNGDERGSRELLEEAVRLDPKYAPALASLAFLYSYWRFSEPNAATDAELEKQSRHLAGRAVALDKRDPHVLGKVAACYNLIGAIGDALRYSEMAIAMSPRDMELRCARAYIIAFAGRHDEGLALVREACKFEPLLPPSFISCLGDCYYLVRDFEAALAAYRTLLDAPQYFKVTQSACLAQLGRTDEAQAIMREVPDTFDATIFARNSAKMCALPDDAELWLSGFRKAGVPV